MSSIFPILPYVCTDAASPIADFHRFPVHDPGQSVQPALDCATTQSTKMKITWSLGVWVEIGLMLLMAQVR